MVSTALEYRLVSPQEFQKLGEGSYQISRVADEQIGEGRHKFSPAEYFVPGDPHTLPAMLCQSLIDNYPFPALKRIILEEARFNDGITTRPRLKHAPLDNDPAKWAGGRGLIKFKGINLAMAFNKSRSYGQERGGDFFSLRELGDLELDYNIWSFLDPIEPNGQFEISTNGYNATEQSAGMMVGSIKVVGDKPGKLIEACLELSGNFLASRGYPLWRKET